MTTANPVEPYTDLLTGGERTGEILIAVGLLLLTGFFLLHQVQNTGFLTERFGLVEMFLLYVPLVLALTDSLLQVISGHHHTARLFEAASGLLLGIAAVWFLIVFPFDFTRLALVLPEGLRFTLAWVNNDLGKIPLVIQVFAGPLGAFTALRLFFAAPG